MGTPLMSRPVDPPSQPRGIFGASSSEQLMMQAVAIIKLPRLQSENSPPVCESISNVMTARSIGRECHKRLAKNDSAFALGLLRIEGAGTLGTLLPSTSVPTAQSTSI